MREELKEIVAGLKEHVRREGVRVGAWKAPAAPARPSAAQAPAAAAPAKAASDPVVRQAGATAGAAGKTGLPLAAAAQSDPVRQTGATASADRKPGRPLAAAAQSDKPGRPLAAAAQSDMPGRPLAAAEALSVLRDEEIGDCQRCPLGATRIKLAFGVGNPEAKVMLIGEGPGYMEDRQGEPFVGPAGQLLDKILAAIELSRRPVTPSWKWVYIANIVKCHPMVDPTDNTKRGNDRPPAPEEIEKCYPFLAEQIRIVRPKFVVALGGVAVKVLLNTTRGITGLRGQWADFRVEGCEPMKLIPTYHPAALLRNPEWKKDVWEDVKKLRAELLASVS
jgi:uracil-DNA glycosylase